MKLVRLSRLPIATRLRVSALLLVLLVLPVAGSVLAWNFREAVDKAFEQRLESLLNVVLASVRFDPASDSLVSNRQLGDPRFEQVFSGWYWQVYGGNAYALTSRSLWDQRLPVTDTRGKDVRIIAGPRDEMLMVVERDVTLPNMNTRLHVSVAADLDEIRTEVNQFKGLLLASLTVLGLLLLVLVELQIRWGLAPLRRLERSLEAVKQGRLNVLDTDLPAELARLSEAINTVLKRDQTLIERGRSTAGNLAHAMKTPVTVLMTQAEQLPPAQRAAMQFELRRLNEAIRHHLARASAAGPVTLGTAQGVKKILAPVIAAIAQLSRRRGLEFDHASVTDVLTRIEPQDFQELVGNLLENATQWAQTQLQLRIWSENDRLLLTIDDDGPGMSEQARKLALERGSRLDQARSGSGLGLAIVRELVALYDGDLQLADSPLGGLRVSVELPHGSC